LREFVERTPVEESRPGITLPPKWPHEGDIEFSNVTARYK
jgi:hypothetical protein